MIDNLWTDLFVGFLYCMDSMIELVPTKIWLKTKSTVVMRIAWCLSEWVTSMRWSLALFVESEREWNFWWKPLPRARLDLCSRIRIENHAQWVELACIWDTCWVRLFSSLTLLAKKTGKVLMWNLLCFYYDIDYSYRLQKLGILPLLRQLLLV